MTENAPAPDRLRRPETVGAEADPGPGSAHESESGSATAVPLAPRSHAVLAREGWRRRVVLATVGSGLWALIVVETARLLEVPLRVAVPGRPITTLTEGLMVTAAVVTSAAGVAFAAACRRTRRPRRLYGVATGTVLAASIAPPFQAAEGAASWLLTLAHVGVWAATTLSVWRLLPASGGRAESG